MSLQNPIRCFSRSITDLYSSLRLVQYYKPQDQDSTPSETNKINVESSYTKKTFSHQDFTRQSSQKLTTLSVIDINRRAAIFQLCMTVDSVAIETKVPLEIVFSLHRFDVGAKNIHQISQDFILRVEPSEDTQTSGPRFNTNHVVVFDDLTESDLQQQTAIVYKVLKNGPLQDNDGKEGGVHRVPIGVGIIKIGSASKKMNKAINETLSGDESTDKLIDNENNQEYSLWDQLWNADALLLSEIDKKNKLKVSNIETNRQIYAPNVKRALMLQDQKVYIMSKEEEFAIMHQKLLQSMTSLASSSSSGSQQYITSSIQSVQNMSPSQSIPQIKRTSSQASSLQMQQRSSIHSNQPPPTLPSIRFDELKGSKGISVTLWLAIDDYEREDVDINWKNGNTQNKENVDDNINYSMDSEEQLKRTLQQRKRYLRIRSPYIRSPFNINSSDKENIEEQQMMQKEVLYLRKVNIEEIERPITNRNDLYLTIDSGLFDKGKKKSEPNIEMTIEIINKDNYSPFPHALFQGKEPHTIISSNQRSNSLSEDGESQFKSFVLYHNKQPLWKEMIHILLTADQMEKAFIIFTFRHISTRKQVEDPFSFAVLPVINPMTGCIEQNGDKYPFVISWDKVKQGIASAQSGSFFKGRFGGSTNKSSSSDPNKENVRLLNYQSIIEAYQLFQQSQSSISKQNESKDAQQQQESAAKFKEPHLNVKFQLVSTFKTNIDSISQILSYTRIRKPQCFKIFSYQPHKLIYAVMDQVLSAIIGIITESCQAIKDRANALSDFKGSNIKQIQYQLLKKGLIASPGDQFIDIEKLQNQSLIVKLASQPENEYDLKNAFDALTRVLVGMQLLPKFITVFIRHLHSINANELYEPLLIYLQGQLEMKSHKQATDKLRDLVKQNQEELDQIKQKNPQITETSQSQAAPNAQTQQAISEFHKINQNLKIVKSNNQAEWKKIRDEKNNITTCFRFYLLLFNTSWKQHIKQQAGSEVQLNEKSSSEYIQEIYDQVCALLSYDEPLFMITQHQLLESVTDSLSDLSQFIPNHDTLGDILSKVIQSSYHEPQSQNEDQSSLLNSALQKFLWQLLDQSFFFRQNTVKNISINVVNVTPLMAPHFSKVPMAPPKSLPPPPPIAPAQQQKQFRPQTNVNKEEESQTLPLNSKLHYATVNAICGLIKQRYFQSATIAVKFIIRVEETINLLTQNVKRRESDLKGKENDITAAVDAQRIALDDHRKKLYEAKEQAKKLLTPLMMPILGWLCIIASDESTFYKYSIEEEKEATNQDLNEPNGNTSQFYIETDDVNDVVQNEGINKDKNQKLKTKQKPEVNNFDKGVIAPSAPKLKMETIEQQFVLKTDLMIVFLYILRLILTKNILKLEVKPDKDNEDVQYNIVKEESEVKLKETEEKENEDFLIKIFLSQESLDLSYPPTLNYKFGYQSSSSDQQQQQGTSSDDSNAKIILKYTVVCDHSLLTPLPQLAVDALRFLINKIYKDGIIFFPDEWFPLHLRQILLLGRTLISLSPYIINIQMLERPEVNYNIEDQHQQVASLQSNQQTQSSLSQSQKFQTPSFTQQVTQLQSRVSQTQLIGGGQQDHNNPGIRTPMKSIIFSKGPAVANIISQPSQLNQIQGNIHSSQRLGNFENIKKDQQNQMRLTGSPLQGSES
ncbi:MAG: hypothetical protein EZS28_007576, partial [Streblomastix strix]